MKQYDFSMADEVLKELNESGYTPLAIDQCPAVWEAGQILRHATKPEVKAVGYMLLLNLIGSAELKYYSQRALLARAPILKRDMKLLALVSDRLSGSDYSEVPTGFDPDL